MKTKHYQLWLPVFKQGDDLRSHLNQNNVPEAFLGLAEQYEEAAAICRKVAGCLAEANPKDIDVQADTHHIGITAPEKLMSSLVADETVREDEWEEEFEDEETDDQE